MSIVTSTIVDDSPQIDGRRWITESHVDQFGEDRRVMYLCAADADVQAVMLSRAARVYDETVQGEIQNNISQITSIGALAVPVFKYSTVAQNVAALRAAYQSATRNEAIFMGEFLSSLTNVQLQNAFGLTAGQVTTLRANKLTPAAALAADIRNAAGQ
jgi:hypothetical protein